MSNDIARTAADAGVGVWAPPAAGQATPGAEVTARHLVRLPGTRWCLWRTAVVRGAGFPARIVDELAAPRASSLADDFVAARALAAERSEQALRRVFAELRTASPDERRRLKDLKRRILAGQPVEPSEDANACAAVAASAELARVEASYRQAYETDTEAVNNRLAVLGREPSFREAMLWQSADSSRRIRNSLSPESRPPHRRAALTQVAMRVQRYCVKNDTIGFFGPVGWASIDERAKRLEVAPGPRLIASRGVYFEDWAIDTLAERLEAKYPIRAWAASRVKAGVWVHGSRAYRPMRKPFPLGEDELAVLAACNGTRTAKEIALAVLARNGSLLGQESAVFEVIERLIAADVLMWRMEAAPQTYPEQELRERLARIGDATLRESCTAALDELIAARDRVASAAGDPDTLDVALTELDNCFTRITDVPASRLGGQTYAARTLVYEDCRRDCDVRIGPSLLADLAEPLAIVLDAAHWAAAQLGRVLRDHLPVCLAELGVKRGEEINCHRFVSYVVSTVWVQGRSALFDATHEQFRQKWEYVLGRPVEESPSRVVFAADEVRARANEVFPQRAVEWTLGRYMSPDLLVAAASVDALCRGEYCAVLGELHTGNTLGAASFLTQHPDVRELFEATDEDTRGETVVYRSFPRPVWNTRTNHGLLVPRHLRYVFGDGPPCHPRCAELPAGKLVVFETESSVVAQAIDGSLRVDVLELVANSLLDDTSRLVADFRPPLPHLPRMVLGNLTVARERWNVTPGEMPFRHATDRARQFAELRAWGRDHGMPRRVFVKCPSERKPWFLDFDSPTYAAIFVAAIRKLQDDAPVSITEMLPDLQDLWLVDRNNEHFTCELRLVARHLA